MCASCRVIIVAVATILAATTPLFAQKPPEIGYVYPAGGRAGTTVEVRLGGYEWTPDMQFFVRDARATLDVLGPPGELLIAPPPYWFGPKGKFPPHLLPRETPARFVIPAEMPAGPVQWQVANANGASTAGVFFVGSAPEVIEDERRRGPQALPSLPVTINGRLAKIEEVDRYRFTTPQAGLVTCELYSRRLGSKFHGIVEIRDAQGRLIADAADTEGLDASITFAAQAGAQYTLSLHDVDFGGDWSFVYRVQLTPGPKVVAAIPAAGRRGETRAVEFIGYGVATGAPQLESVTKQVTFPANSQAATFEFTLETPFGATPPFALALSDLSETIESPAAASAPPPTLTLPAAITGVLAQRGEEDRFVVTGKKDDVWEISLDAQRIGSRLDPALTILAADGKELARSDDLPGTTDAALTFTVPADGAYTLVVSDLSGKAGTRAAVYRLVVEPEDPEGAIVDFTLDAPRLLNLPIGGKAELQVTATRRRGFEDAIAIAVEGLPPGVTVPADLAVPAVGEPAPAVVAGKKPVVKKSPKKPATAPLPGQVVFKIPLDAAADAASIAALVKVIGRVKTERGEVIRSAAPMLLATTMKPRAKVEPVDKDGARTVHRGSTWPADVIVTRMEGYAGEVILQQASSQSYQVQGITGHDVLVAPGVTRTYYGCYMPEWLELDRTSRMVLVAVAKTPDPKGNVRHLVTLMDGRITMLLEGALLKLSHSARELAARPGDVLEIPVKLARSPKLSVPVRLELVVPQEFAGLLTAEPVTLSAKGTATTFRVQTIGDTRLAGTCTFTIKATALPTPDLPVISQTDVTVEFNTPQRAGP